MEPGFERTDRVSFSVQTIHVREGQELARIRPDEDGYYIGFPVAALGRVTRNRTYYDIHEFQAQLTNEASHFRMALEDGQLYGEWGHPKVHEIRHADPLMRKRFQLERLARIDEEKVSHHFRAIRTGSEMEGGGKLIVADIKPAGPYKAALEDSLDSPHVNTAFSLRAITRDRRQGDVTRKKTVRLVTFDAVTTSGYAEASKRFREAGSTEEIDVRFDEDLDMATIDEVGLESLSNTELSDMFRTKDIFRETRSRTVLTGDGVKDLFASRTPYHDLITRKES